MQVCHQMKKSSNIKRLTIGKSISGFGAPIFNIVFLQMPFTTAVISVKLILKFGSVINYKSQAK